MQKIEIYLSLTGESFNPQNLTDALGVWPSYSHMKGVRLKHNPNASFSQWCISSGVVEGDGKDVYAISRSLIEKISNKEDQISKLKHQYNLDIVFQVSIGLSQSCEVAHPAIGFDTSTVDFLSSIGASIDVDINWNIE